MVLKRWELGFIVFLSMTVNVNVLRAIERVPAPGCQEEATAFLGLPSEHTLAVMSGTNETTCWAIIESSNGNLNKLDHWVEQGNRWAAEYLAKHLKVLDGGNLEDALVALGQFSIHDMERFLFFAKSGLLSKHEMSDALTMLPLSLSDDPRGQLESLATRRRKIMRVARKDLANPRAEALAAIDEFVAEIRSKNSGRIDRP